MMMRISLSNATWFAQMSAFLAAFWLPGPMGPPDGFSNARVGTVARERPARATQSGLKKGDKKHSVTLHWDPSTSTVAGYNVYRRNKRGGPYKRLNASPVQGTSYIDSTVLAGRKYYYVVKSVTAKNVESIVSNEISAVIPAR